MKFSKTDFSILHLYAKVKFDRKKYFKRIVGRKQESENTSLSVLTLFWLGGGKSTPPTLKSAVNGRKSENFQK